MSAQAHEISDGYYADSNCSRIPTTRHLYEEARRLYGNLCQNSFTASRLSPERFIHYSHDQGLIGESHAPERLFVPSTLDT